MSDLVERLRAAGHDERLAHGPLYREAADEIERLRSERDRYRDDFRQRELDLGEMYETIRQANDEFENLRIERDQLRSILAEAITLLEWSRGAFHHAAYGVDHTPGCPVCDFLDRLYANMVEEEPQPSVPCRWCGSPIAEDSQPDYPADYCDHS